MLFYYGSSGKNPKATIVINLQLAVSAEYFLMILLDSKKLEQ